MPCGARLRGCEGPEARPTLHGTVGAGGPARRSRTCSVGGATPVHPNSTRVLKDVLIHLSRRDTSVPHLDIPSCHPTLVPETSAHASAHQCMSSAEPVSPRHPAARLHDDVENMKVHQQLFSNLAVCKVQWLFGSLPGFILFGRSGVWQEQEACQPITQNPVMENHVGLTSFRYIGAV